ncbi:MAG: MFS transporter [Nitrospinota bacterium]
MRHTFLITAWLLWFLAHSTRMILSPVLPLIEDDLGLSHAQAGQLFVFLTAGYCTSLFSVPVWSRVLGYRRTVQAALAVLALTQILLYRAAGMKEMAALMFLVGLTTGTILPSAIPLLTAAYGKERWGRSIGVFDSAAPAGQFIAPVIAIAVLSVLSWRYVFWVMAAIAAMVIVMFVRTAPESEPRAERPRGSLAAVIRNRSLVTLAGLWALASAAGIGLGFLVPTYLVKERGMDLTAANQIFAAGRGMGILAAVYAGFLADRFTCRSLLVWILAVSGLSQMGIALWPENFGVGFGSSWRGEST